MCIRDGLAAGFRRAFPGRAVLRRDGRALPAVGLGLPVVAPDRLAEPGLDRGLDLPGPPHRDHGRGLALIHISEPTRPY